MAYNKFKRLEYLREKLGIKDIVNKWVSPLLFFCVLFC